VPITTDPATALAKADSHPIRRAIVAHMRHLDRPVTPGEMATDFGCSLGVVAYHFRMLRDYGLVSLDHMEPRRGALQHFYVLTPSAPDGHALRYEELRGWVTEALNLPGAPYGEARQALLNGLVGVTRQAATS
jgi:DNA-binding transcriptional ArsR family regulator